MENAAIYSHANYLANGNLTDRTTSEPVVTATGNVTIKGNVYIAGDDAGSEIGQTALRVSNGTLHLEDDAQLVLTAEAARPYCIRMVVQQLNWMTQ